MAAEWEREVLYLVTCRWHAPWFVRPLEFAQSWVHGVVFLGVACGVVALHDPRRGFRALAAAGLGAGLALAIGTGLWYAVGRERPARTYEHVLRSEAELATCAEHPEAFALRSHGPRSPSFPSHHALTIGAFAMALWLAWKPVGAFAWFVALVVCWGRLYFGKHWPSDVLGGLVIGAVLAWASWRVVPAILRRIGLRWLDPPPAGV